MCNPDSKLGKQHEIIGNITNTNEIADIFKPNMELKAS